MAIHWEREMPMEFWPQNPPTSFGGYPHFKVDFNWLPYCHFNASGYSRITFRLNYFGNAIAFMKEKIEVAWRVLTCIRNHTDPVEADVESLRSWVDPQDRAADSDDLAYIVIAAEVEQREELRKIATLQ